MHNLESALSNAQERQSMLEKLWPSKSAIEEVNIEKILCFVDANNHSFDALNISVKLAKEFDSDFVIRSLFDEELKKLTSEDLSHLKQSIIEIVKESFKDSDVSKNVTFLEGDAISAVSSQLIIEYDIIVLPVPYHSNLSDHPDAVALGSLGEYLVRKSTKPLFLVSEVEEKKDDPFSSIIVVVNDVSDLIQNENYINAIVRNRSHLHFVYVYDSKDIENLAKTSKGVIDADLVKKRVHEKLEQYGEVTVKKFNEHIESVEYSIFNENFSENIQSLIKNVSASLLTIILPENKAGHGYLLYQEMLRDKKLQLPIMILRIEEEKKAETLNEKENDEEEKEEEILNTKNDEIKIDDIQDAEHDDDDQDNNAVNMEKFA